MRVFVLGDSGGLSGLAEPRVWGCVEGGRAACRTRTVPSVPELQKAQKLEQVDRIGDETIGLLVANALEAGRESLGAVLARFSMAFGKRHERRNSSKSSSRREERLEEHRSR